MSNRLTFSLASLIFLIALGLIFVPTSVLAHGPNTIGLLRSHPHPVNTAIPGQDLNADGDTNDIGEGAVSTHNAHPIPTLSLKPDAADATTAKVKDNMVVIASADSQTNAIDANEFVLVVDFDQDVVNASNIETVDRTNETLPTLTFLSATVNANGVTIANGVQLGTPARVAGTDNSKFEIVVLVDSAAIPTGTAALKTATVRVQLRQTVDDGVGGTTESVVYGLAKTPQFAQVPGGESEASNYFEITLVQTLPTPDTAGPVATIAPPTALVGGMANFTISFDEALGTNGLTLSDLTITGQDGWRTGVPLTGTLTEDTIALLPTYSLAVTPRHATYGYVNVAMAAGAVNDALGNNSLAHESPFILADNQQPRVAIWVGSTRSQPVYGEGRDKHVIDRNGQVNFTLSFSEPMQKRTNTVSYLQPTDFRITRYSAKDGEVDLTSGVQISSVTAEVHDWTVDNRDGIATTASLNPANAPNNLKGVDLYRLSVPATDMFNDGGQHIRIELDVNAVTDEAGNTVEQWFSQNSTWVNPHATFDTIPPIVRKITPGYVVDENSPKTPNTMRDDTFVPLKMEGGKYVGTSRDYIAFKFEFSEALDPAFTTDDLDSDGLANGRYIRDSRPYKVDKKTGEPLTGEAIDDPNNLTYVVVVETVDKSQSTTILMRRRSIWDQAGNFLQDDVDATYTVEGDVTPPTITIKDVVAPLDCEFGSKITFEVVDPETPPTTSGLDMGSTDAAKAKRTVTADEVEVSTGWMIETQTDKTLKLVPKRDGSEIGITTVTVSVKAGAAEDIAGNKSAATTPVTYIVGPVLSIPAGGYITVIRSEHENTTHLNDPLILGSTGVRGPQVPPETWDCMPDLTVFFGRKAPGVGGGALVVKESPAHDKDDKKPAIVKGTVGISEIMWSSDEGLPHGGSPPGHSRSNLDQAREQWIELHNLNPFEVKVTVFARETAHALTVETDEIDRVSNYQIGNVWEVKGQSGNSQYGTDFISMQRLKGFDAKDRSKGEVPTLTKNYSHGDFNGKAAGSWHVSVLTYLTEQAGLANTGQLDKENLNYDFRGTPGRSNKLGVSTPILRTKVAKDSIVFNEISNRRDQTLEWIELKNVSDAIVNLKKYQISLATAQGTDTKFYEFPDNDNTQIAPGELLLLVDTNPRDNDTHPVAVGYNIHAGTDQALGIGENPGIGTDGKVNAHYTGDAPRYMVTNFAEGGLPDNGNFVLLLRNGNDKIGTHEKVIDAIGWSDKLTDNTSLTKVWPLRFFSAPDARNTIAVETVHRRQHTNLDPDQYSHGDKKDEHVALRDAGYTGVGYKRHAQRIAANGGTPGYEDTRKNLVADVTKADGVLTISEIMYAQGDGEYPQWIEIYNSSDVPVNLHSEAGWRLVIQNFDDGEIPVETLSGTLNFKNSDVQTILPKQTVMVTSTRARNSGSAFFDTRVIFPATRVFSAWDDQRGELTAARARSTDPILSEKGFYIELIDGKGNVSDGVGNLVKSPNRRVAATIEWELSEVTGEMMDDMGRSSILRRYGKYEDGKYAGPYSPTELADMGIEAAGWLAAHQTDFRNVRQTWYGHGDDIGSPGITAGRVLPVSLSKFRPERLKDTGEIVIRWITESELNNAGFNILRSETRTGEFTKINTSLIKGHGTTSERNTYEWKDTTAKPNVVYYYQIQDVSLDGEVQTLRQSRLKGNVTAAGKATTTWGELKALQ